MLAPWVKDDRDETTLKSAFAAALLRTPHDAFAAACSVFGTDTARALTVANSWVYDTDVLQFQADMIKEFGEDAFLPSKLTLARRIYDLGNDVRAELRDRLAAFKLYAELRNFIEKPAVVQNNVTVNQNRVMVVRDHGTNDEWAVKVRSQQARLIEHARD